MYVHVTADGTLYYGQPPGTAADGLQSWDLSDRDPARMAAAGWYAVDVSPRPADTDEITHDGEVVVTDGIPTHTWIARPWTPEEVVKRAESAARLVSIEKRLSRIETHLWPAPPNPTSTTGVPTMADYSNVWPSGGLLLDGGKVWRNVTEVPLTKAPSGFPGSPSQWSHLFVEITVIPPAPEPEPGVLAWAVGQQVAVGDKRTHGGRVWTAKLDHTTHEGWEPSAATHAVWTDSGPAGPRV